MADGQPAGADRRQRAEPPGSTGGADRKEMDNAPAAAAASVGSSAGQVGLMPHWSSRFDGAVGSGEAGAFAPGTRPLDSQMNPIERTGDKDVASQFGLVFASPDNPG